MLSQEHRDQILNRFDRSSTNFRRLLTGLTGFAAVFFLIILVPYVSIELTRDRIPQQRKELSQEIDRRTEIVRAIGRVEEGIKRLRTAIDSSPDRLAAFIEDLNRARRNQEDLARQVQGPAVQQQIQQSAPSETEQAEEGSCASIEEVEARTECLVHEEVQNQFSAYQQILTREVLEPLRAARDSGMTPPVDPAVLEREFAALQATFNRKLEENPHFWYTRSNKDSFFVELAEEVNQAWTQYGKSLSSESTKLQRKLEELKTARRELEERLGELEAEEEAIEKRLAEIQSPLGNLPVGLTESMLLFPLILAAGFLMLTSSFTTTVRLRKILHGFYLQDEPDAETKEAAPVAVIAPLWIDPIDSGQTKLFRYAVLLIPFLIFLIACSLVVYLGLLSDSSIGGRPLIGWIYLPLYAVGLLGFLYGFYRIRSAVENYQPERLS